VIRFLFDYVSPYAYLAWTQIHAVAARHGREVEPVPVLFAGLLDAWGHKGPAEIPPKRVYVFKDCLRIAKRLGVPLVPPPTHPFNPLVALRISSLPTEPGARKRLVDALFLHTWGGAGDGIEGAARVAAIASGVGLDGASLVASANDPAVKARLKEATDAAIASGVFGVPTMLVDGEPFWGLDALPSLEMRLRGDDPVTDATLAAWSHIAPSAQRSARS
jgi:2-hydroxychromene-2-carboxylate isomerase